MKNTFFLTLLLTCFLASCQKNITTPYDYALLSAHVYDDDVSTLPQHWIPYLDFDNDNFSPSLHLEIGSYKKMVDNEEWLKLGTSIAGKFITWGGYFGRAYINEKSNEVIIAHRGTDLDLKIQELSVDHISIALEDGKIWDMLKDIDDDYEILEGKIPMQQFEAAQHFTQKVKETFKKQYNSEPTIIHTGHSLGAVLAELCAVKDDTKAITFESPGSKPMIAQLADNQSLNIENPDITTYNAEPNQINTLHEHMGKVIPLYDESGMNNLHSDAAKVQSLQQHSIRELLKRFDEKSGEPNF